MLQAIRTCDDVVLVYQHLVAMRAFDEGVLGFPVYRGLDGWIERRASATLLTRRRRDRPYDGPPPQGAACYSDVLPHLVDIVVAGSKDL